MSVTWNNAYHSMEKGGIYSCTAMPEDSPSQCRYWSSLPQNADHWARIEERWNGHLLCTPVGMRGEQASHQWIRKFYTHKSFPIGLGPWELESRK